MRSQGENQGKGKRVDDIFGNLHSGIRKTEVLERRLERIREHDGRI